MLAREFGWTLEDMEKLTPQDLYLIVKELKRQTTFDSFIEKVNSWYFLAAVISNGFKGIGKALSGKKGSSKSDTVQAKDFLSDEGKKLYDYLYPQKEQVKGKDKWNKHIEQAKKKGIKVPRIRKG